MKNRGVFQVFVLFLFLSAVEAWAEMERGLTVHGLATFQSRFTSHQASASKHHRNTGRWRRHIAHVKMEYSHNLQSAKRLMKQASALEKMSSRPSIKPTPIQAQEHQLQENFRRLESQDRSFWDSVQDDITEGALYHRQVMRTLTKRISWHLENLKVHPIPSTRSSALTGHAQAIQVLLSEWRKHYRALRADVVWR